jgi:hypothetical protein
VTFLRNTPDLWDLVADCRLGITPHQRRPPHRPAFDVAYGPVTLWPQRLTIFDSDQIGFHTERAVRGLDRFPPWIADIGSPIFTT